MRKTVAGLVIAAAMLVPSTMAAASAAPATSYHISEMYAAGVSSGGYMATQLHVAYSNTIKGEAVFAAGPYYCAQGSITRALNTCTKAFGSDQLSTLEATTTTWSQQGTIDPVANLTRSPVWLFHGSNDTTVAGPLVSDLAAYHRHFGATVTYDATSSAGHAWISPRGPNPCTVTQSPYVNNCGTDLEGTFLRSLIGSVAAPNAGRLTGTTKTIDQNVSAPGGSASAISMGTTAFLYAPSSCASGATCRLVIALHGCQQGSSVIGSKFVDTANLNQYADTNQLLVLYPQAVATSGSNPQGCWDWWGYTGSGYAQHGAPQMETIMRMARTLSS